MNSSCNPKLLALDLKENGKADQWMSGSEMPWSWSQASGLAHTDQGILGYSSFIPCLRNRELG